MKSGSHRIRSFYLLLSLLPKALLPNFFSPTTLFQMLMSFYFFPASDDTQKSHRSRHKTHKSSGSSHKTMSRSLSSDSQSKGSISTPRGSMVYNHYYSYSTI